MEKTRKDGIWLEWWQDGKLHYKKLYLNDGTSQVYHDSGQLVTSAAYKTGVMQGLEMQWLPYSNAWLRDNYRDGVPQAPMMR